MPHRINDFIDKSMMVLMGVGVSAGWIFSNLDRVEQVGRIIAIIFTILSMMVATIYHIVKIRRVGGVKDVAEKIKKEVKKKC